MTRKKTFPHNNMASFRLSLDEAWELLNRAINTNDEEYDFLRFDAANDLGLKAAFDRVSNAMNLTERQYYILGANLLKNGRTNEAITMLEPAHKLGNGAASFRLGVIFRYGLNQNGKADLNRAFEYFKAARDYGYGTPKNDPQQELQAVMDLIERQDMKSGANIHILDQRRA